MEEIGLVGLLDNDNNVYIHFLVATKLLFKKSVRSSVRQMVGNQLCFCFGSFLFFCLLHVSSKYKMCRQFSNHTHGPGQTDGPNELKFGMHAPSG